MPQGLAAGGALGAREGFKEMPAMGTKVFHQGNDFGCNQFEYK
jgi:hypothetical protein